MAADRVIVAVEDIAVALVAAVGVADTVAVKAAAEAEAVAAAAKETAAVAVGSNNIATCDYMLD